MKLCIHSITDLITNSSTTIYTYSDASPQACREMIDSIFESFGMPHKCDDIFNLVLLLDQDYRYEYWLKREGHIIGGDLDELIKNIKAGKVEKPSWMVTAEEDNDESGGTTLHISAKNPNFDHLAKKIYNFLYSTNAEEGSD